MASYDPFLTPFDIDSLCNFLEHIDHFDIFFSSRIQEIYNEISVILTKSKFRISLAEMVSKE